MARGKVNHKHEINGILYLVVAALFGVAYYAPGAMGVLGNVLLDGGRGLLGMAAYALPVIFAYMAIDYFLEKQMKITRLRFTHVFLFLVGSAAMMQILSVDQAVFHQAGQPTMNAWQSLTLLWEGGIDPAELALNGEKVLTGGLFGGGVAQAMYAIAGQTGAIILIAALLLSQLVLLLNVSLSRAVGKTAEVIQQTGQRVNTAVRSSVVNIRESRAADAQNAKSFDIDLEKDQAAKTDDMPGETPVEPEKKKYSLIDSLKRLWQDDDQVVPTLPEAELSVPGFLMPDGEAPTQAQSTVGGNVRRSAYDIQLNKNECIDDDDEDDAVNVLTPETTVHLPAGVRRVDPIGVEAGDVLEDGRSKWADRTAEVTTGATVMPVRVTGKPGSQLSLDIPYQAPPLNLLREDIAQIARSANNPAIQALGKKLEHTLKSFGIEATVVHVTTGPTITRFELSPGPGVKVSRIVSLSDDIALNLAAMGVRIEAPIPGKSAIGIEIPNKETSPVLLRGILESPEFKKSASPLTAVIGRDIQGFPILCDLAKMPHLLIAGATGSGKSVCINSILMSILYRTSPDDVRLMMIDPKVVELSVYNGIPHLLAPVVTDPKKAANTLLWAVNEMTRRYGLFAEKAVRDINSYNAAALRGEDDFEKLPLILFVIDELSDLMATTPTEVEDAIARLTAMARAAGIHLIIATQRPSVDVITGVIKANIPSRIAFAVASQVDSRTILDMGGAEKLLGKGDMLYYPQSSAKPIRGQGAFITDSEVERVLTYIKAQHAAEYDPNIANAIMTAPAVAGRERDSSDQDELLPQALGIVVETGYASVSLLQRRMNVGYPRAARLIDRMNEMGYVGPFEGSKPRKVLITPGQYLELKAREGN